MDEIKADSRSSYYLIILFALFNTFYKLLVLGASEWYWRFRPHALSLLCLFTSKVYPLLVSPGWCVYVTCYMANLLHWSCVLYQIASMSSAQIGHGSPFWLLVLQLVHTGEWMVPACILADFCIKMGWSLQFLGYLRTLSLKLQKVWCFPDSAQLAANWAKSGKYQFWSKPSEILDLENLFWWILFSIRRSFFNCVYLWKKLCPPIFH